MIIVVIVISVLYVQEYCEAWFHIHCIENALKNCLTVVVSRNALTFGKGKREETKVYISI
jgi:hypothetical protein